MVHPHTIGHDLYLLALESNVFKSSFPDRYWLELNTTETALEDSTLHVCV